MKRFYQSADLRSRQTMTSFLTEHFRYPTMNSWNRSTSYACNLKLYNLGLEREIEDKLYELIQTQEFFDIQAEMLSAFGNQHQFRWQVGMNGRSSGYLVLYQGELKPSGSVLLHELREEELSEGYGNSQYLWRLPSANPGELSSHASAGEYIPGARYG